MGGVAFGISSSIFPEGEPYAGPCAALNTTVLPKESIFLFLKRICGKYVALLISLEQLDGIVHVPRS